MSPDHIQPIERIFDDLMPEKQSLAGMLRPQFNSWQKWSCRVMIGLLVLTFIFGGLYAITKIEEFALCALLGQILMMLSAIFYQLTIIAPELDKLANPERTLLEPAIKQFTNDLKRSHWIATTFDEISIQYAQQRLSLLLKHFRSRIALMVGAIEKVGFIPLGLTAYLALTKLQTENKTVSFAALDWAGYVLAFFYVMALIAHQISQNLERHELIYKMALDIKRNQKSKSSE